MTHRDARRGVSSVSVVFPLRRPCTAFDGHTLGPGHHTISRALVFAYLVKLARPFGPRELYFWFSLLRGCAFDPAGRRRFCQVGVDLGG